MFAFCSTIHRHRGSRAKKVWLSRVWRKIWIGDGWLIAEDKANALCVPGSGWRHVTSSGGIWIEVCKLRSQNKFHVTRKIIFPSRRAQLCVSRNSIKRHGHVPSANHQRRWFWQIQIYFSVLPNGSWRTSHCNLKAETQFLGLEHAVIICATKKVFSFKCFFFND